MDISFLQHRVLETLKHNWHQSLFILYRQTRSSACVLGNKQYYFAKFSLMFTVQLLSHSEFNWLHHVGW